MAKAISFYNWTDEDFIHTWDKTEYEFPAGSKMLLEEGLARHFAKHLTDRELLKMKDEKGDQLMTNHFSRAEVLSKCFPDATQVEGRNEVDLQIKLDNQVPGEQVKQGKAGKPRKEVEEINPAFAE